MDGYWRKVTNIAIILFVLYEYRRLSDLSFSETSGTGASSHGEKTIDGKVRSMP